METQQAQPSARRPHIWYFDYLRVMAMICVIFMHVAAGPLRADMTLGWHLTNINTSFAFTAVPLFFMMSGYLLLHDKRTQDVSTLRRRVLKLLFPLVFWSVAAAAWLTWLNERTVRGFLQRCIAGLHEPVMVHMWFLYTLIAFYLIAPILYGGLNALDKQGKRFFVVLIVLVLVQSTATSFWPNAGIDLFDTLRLFNGHLSAFLLGYFLGEWERRVPNWLLLTVGFADLFVIIVGTTYLTVKNAAYTQTFQSQNNGFELLLASCVFLFFKQNFDRKTVLHGVAAPLVSLSMGIYLSHNIVNSIISVYWFPTIGFKLLCAKTVLTLLFSYVLTKTLATIPFLCYLTTGVPYQTACSRCNWIAAFHKKK